MKRWSRCMLATAASIAALAAGCGHPKADKAPPVAKVQNSKPEAELAKITLTAEAETRLAIQTAMIGVETVTLTRTVGGEAVAPPGRSAVVTSPTAGTLVASEKELVFRRVKKGQTIFELVPLGPSERDARSEAERLAREAAARLTESQQRLLRQTQLLTAGAVSARAVEEAKAARDVADAADGAARDRLATLARLRIGARGELAMTAPFDGVLTAVRAASGQSVNAGAPLFEMAQISPIWVRVSLYAGEFATVEPNANAAVSVLGADRPEPWLQAKPVAGLPTADPAAASADLFYELSNHDETVRPGERLTVRLPLHGSEPALVIPRSAVVYDLTGGTWVYEVSAPHVFERKRVEIGGASGSGVIVRRGLAAGAAVVTVGAAELYGTEFFVGR